MSFLVGVNYPWLDCGHDFGDKPPGYGPQGPVERWQTLETELRALRQDGVRVVRWWVLAGGIGYPAGLDARAWADVVPARVGPLGAMADVVWAGLGDRLPFGLGRWRAYDTLRLRPEAVVPALPGPFLQDFGRLLDACDAAGVQLLPSLVSFEWFQPFVALGEGASKRGRGAFVFGHRGDGVEAFLDATLAPLLEVSATRPNAVWAWELINEPGWAVPGGSPQFDASAYGWVPTARTETAAAMSLFIARGVERITEAGSLATVGFADPEVPWLTDDAWSVLRRRAQEGRYVHQRHHYPRGLGGHLPEASESPITPCLLAEFPTARPNGLDVGRWRDRELRHSETDDQRRLRARLALIRARGYSGALPWSVRSGDRQRAFGPRERSQLRG